MAAPTTSIRPADTPELLAVARELFEEYAETLGFDLCFQDFAAELAHMGEQYGRPAGALLLGFRGSDIAGCVGVRRFAEQVCEMKRLYVRPEFRKKGVGRVLAVAAGERARQSGYRAMRLDTVPTMVEAITMYRSLGFVEIAPYRTNPVEGAVFLELDLTAT